MNSIQMNNQPATHILTLPPELLIYIICDQPDILTLRCVCKSFTLLLAARGLQTIYIPKCSVNKPNVCKPKSISGGAIQHVREVVIKHRLCGCVPDLAQLPNVIHLSISKDALRWRETQIVPLILKIKMLQQLIIELPIKLENGQHNLSAFAASLQQLTGLTTISITGLQKFGYVDLSILLKNNPELKHLNIPTIYLNDSGISVIAAYTGTLYTLGITCRNVPNIFNRAQSLQTLKQLHICTDIITLQFASGVALLSNLQLLTLEGAINGQFDTNVDASYFVQHVSKLVLQSIRITSQQLKQIAQGPNLRILVLHFVNCSQTTFIQYFEKSKIAEIYTMLQDSPLTSLQSISEFDTTDQLIKAGFHSYISMRQLL